MNRQSFRHKLVSGGAAALRRAQNTAASQAELVAAIKACMPELDLAEGLIEDAVRLHWPELQRARKAGAFEDDLTRRRRHLLKTGTLLPMPQPAVVSASAVVQAREDEEEGDREDREPGQERAPTQPMEEA